jgi:hypothetical protein
MKKSGSPYPDAWRLLRKAETLDPTSPLSNINALLFNPFSQEGVHFFAKANDVYPPPEPVFHFFFEMNEQEGVGRLRGNAQIHVTALPNLATGNGAENAKGKDAILFGTPLFEVTQNANYLVSIHGCLHLMLS